MTTTRQRKSSPEESKHDVSYDLAQTLFQSASISRICYDNALNTGMDCWKQCYIHSELALCLANILVATHRGGEPPSHVLNLDISGLIQAAIHSAKSVSSVCGSHKSNICQKCKEHSNQMLSALETYQETHLKGEETKSGVTGEPATPKKTGRPRRGAVPTEVEAKEE